MSFKKTSSVFNVGASVTESAANTFTQEQVTLPLSSLDREVFIMTDVQMSGGNIIGSAGVSATSDVQVTKTSQTGLLGINDPDILGKLITKIDNNVPTGPAVMEDRHPGNSFSTGTDRDYLAIIATPNFFIATVSSNQAGALSAQCRITGYRAKANADTYAALVTEELNS